MIVSKPAELIFERNFIFFGNEILVKEYDAKENKLLTQEFLPGKDVALLIIKQNNASDYYSESDYEFNAFMLNEKIEFEGYKFIELRQFFWDAKYSSKIKSESRLLVTMSARSHSLLLQRSSFRYCPTCGTLLEDDRKFTARFCPKCQMQIFPRIEPCIITLVSRGDEYLLVQNKAMARTGRFSCVAGFVEQGETVEECVMREVLEETNIRVKNIRYCGSQAWPFPDQLMIAFKCDYESGELKIQEEELSDAGWFRKDNLPKNLPLPGSVAYNLIYAEL